ncbi:hypothetical protein [Streptomyces sp. NPDC058745]|uniref:hypothetical protein n=1 Tax=Streptomyces sp. NPDC058745 TaxID=3346621 RepID=UPI00369BF032
MSSARTLHEEIAEGTLDDLLTNPGSAAVLAEWRRRFKQGDYDPRLVARIGQTQRLPRYWPLEQVASFVQVHAGLMSGLYAHVEVSVGAKPGPDADREENAQKLRRVHRLFQARLDLDQHGGDYDGWVSWATTVKTNRSSGLGLVMTCGTIPVNMGFHVPAGGVPLEVGSTKASRTYMHLHQDGGVARWPYDDDRIHLLLNVEDFRMRARAERQAS